MSTLMRVILAIAVIAIAFKIVLTLVGTVMWLIHTAITLAIIVGVIWLLVQIFSVKKAY